VGRLDYLDIEVQLVILAQLELLVLLEKVAQVVHLEYLEILE
jgi:hypothetical protein